MKIIGIATWIVGLCSCVQMTLCSRITLEDNGYKGILVAIHRSVPENEDLVTNLKMLFTNASKFLYAATKGRVYFKEIIIAVPSNWTWKPNYVIQSGNHFSVADVQVDQPNPAYGDAPYTEQPGGCGEAGDYIHLTPRFVEEIDKVTEMFGKPERQLVHEWAHLRYGVFDEYGIPGNQFYPTFYIQNGKVRPTTCTGNIPGWIRSANGELCYLLPNGHVNSDCIFIPDMTAKTAKASIMSMPFVPNIDSFCDDGPDTRRKHNTGAPTRQNAMCNGESTWSVISSHADFSNAKRNAAQNLIPTFQVIQPPSHDKGTFVLVLDVSGSMSGTPLTLLRQAATRLIEDRIPDGARLGIVQFASDATILQPLTTVSSVTRNILRDSLPSQATSSTAIGKGLLKGIEVLKDGKSSPAGGLIILVTDGEENVTPYINDVTPDILKERIVVNTVAFGTYASQKLEELTKETGGKAYFFADLSGVQSSAGLDSAFLESVTVQSEIELQPQRLINKVFDLDNAVVEKTIIIDNDLGKDTVFTVTSPYIGKVDLVLKSPTGVTYNYQSSEYSRDVNRRDRIQVSLPMAESGKWVITFSRQDQVSFPVTLSVLSKPRNGGIQPITVKAWLNNPQVKFPGQVKVYATVRKGQRVVIGATVLGRVEGPTANTVEIILRDNGAGADLTKNDGIYSGFFTQFTTDGRYAVTAEVLNDGKAKLKLNVKFSRGTSIPKVKGPFNEKPSTEFTLAGLTIKQTTPPTVNDDNTGDPVAPFQRESDAGSFRLIDWKPNSGDIIPPGDIKDLLVLYSNENYETRTAEVTLQWTAVGDDLDFGQAESYELLVSTDIDGFRKDPSSGFKVLEKNVTKGSLQPLPPGQNQNVTVQVSFSDDTETLYFAMRAKDEAGNVSSKSNIAPLYISAKKEVAKRAHHLRIVKALVIFEDE